MRWWRWTQANLEAGEAALAGRLREHVDRLAGLIGARHAGRPTSIEATLAYLVRAFEAMGAVSDGVPLTILAYLVRAFEAMGHRVEHQTYDAHGQTATNLQVELAGSDRAEEIVILGAHYDTVPGTPGADDNASAVAALIEVARLLGPHRPKRTLRFVAFANEEPPHFFTDTMGSRVYARRCRARGERITAMVCLEMIGYYDTSSGSQRYPEGLPARLARTLPNDGDFLAAVANPASWRLLLPFYRGFRRSSRLRLIPAAIPARVPGIDFSDHSSFWNEGYPALMVTDTSFLRNPHYHVPGDTPDTLDYPRLALATLGVAGAVGRLAGVRGRMGSLRCAPG